jgi:pectate lyase
MLRAFALTTLLAASTFASPPAFPGAEGLGADATGGRAGEVYEVINLDDTGPGSLRDALSEGNRTVVFSVSGTIDLKTTIRLTKPNVTIAGQTAPGDGICLRGKELMIRADNVIVRFMRFRPGDELKQEHDALTVWNARNVIIDHCSMSWSTDSVSDVVKGSRDTTIQWCIIAEPLTKSAHSKGAHGYGTGWGYGSYHHNLLAHCDSRTPRLGADPTRGFIEVANNVIYNWGFGWAYGGEHSDINFVGNYLRPGPSSKHNESLFNAWLSNTRIHLSGNVVDGNDAITADNVKGLITKGSIHKNEPIVLDEVSVKQAFPTTRPVATQPAAEAMELVLAKAGATLPKRDSVDTRVVKDVREKTGKIINSQADVGGWPELKSAEAPADTDKDGMPDAWEAARGLNAADPKDGKSIGPDGYSNLELYLNELASKAP